ECKAKSELGTKYCLLVFPFCDVPECPFDSEDVACVIVIIMAARFDRNRGTIPSLEIHGITGDFPFMLYISKEFFPVIGIEIEVVCNTPAKALIEGFIAEKRSP